MFYEAPRKTREYIADHVDTVSTLKRLHCSLELEAFPVQAEITPRGCPDLSFL